MTKFDVPDSVIDKKSFDQGYERGLKVGTLLERIACLQLCDELATQARKDWKQKCNPYDDGRSDGMYECYEVILARDEI